MDFNQYESVEKPAHNGSVYVQDWQRLKKQRLNLSQPKDFKTPIKTTSGIGLTSYQNYNSSTNQWNTNLPSGARLRMKTLAGNGSNSRRGSEEGVLQNNSAQPWEKRGQRCATEQSCNTLAGKFGWKSIPDNLTVKRKYTLEVNNKQLNPKKNNNWLRPQKPYTMTQTKVSTNGFQSLEVSKQIQKEPQAVKPQIQSPDTQPSIPDNQYFTYFEALKSMKLREHEIQQVESITRSRVSQGSIMKEQKEVQQFVLDESFIYWTYQTGFENPLGNLVNEKQT